jgi:predicted ABC-type ATPase
MMSILPDPVQGHLPKWARELRDTDERWMKLSQSSVQTFIELIIERRMAFAFETVFSHWEVRADGTIASKIDLIKKLQEKGYVVALLFVGLASSDLSIARVATRVALGGHDVEHQRLRDRFPRTQQAIRQASSVADATLMFDNSQDGAGFRLALIRTATEVMYDVRNHRISKNARTLATAWLDIVEPRS